MVSCLAYKAKGDEEREGGGSLWSDGICLPKQSLSVTEPCSPDNHLPMDRGEGIPYFALLALRALALNYLHFNPQIYSLLPF